MEDAVDLSALVIWMDSHCLGAGPITNVRKLTGGTQNIMLRFSRGARDFVFRRPPVHLRKNSNQTMGREARILSALSETQVPHPGFIASCEDETVIGACFYLMEPVEGFNITAGMPDYHANDPAVRRRMGLSYIESIASLGAVDYKAVGLEGFGKPEKYLERQPARWMGQLESYAAFDNWMGMSVLPDPLKIVDWLERHMPASYEIGIIHGDCHLANVMFCDDSPEIAALVDWELSTLGDPLLDLGWVIASWPEVGEPRMFEIDPWDGFPTLAELIAHYGEHSTRSLDAIEWYGVLACFKLGAILEGTHARACAGKAPKEIGDYLHNQTIALFEKATRMLT